VSFPPLHFDEQPLADGHVRLTLSGDLDYDTAVFARRAIARTAAAERRLVIDLSGVRRADAFGWAVLVKAATSEDVVLADPSRAIRDVSRATGTGAMMRRHWARSTSPGTATRTPTR
jgi:anti-anti-sigma factor